MRWTIHNDSEKDAVCRHIASIILKPGKPYEITVKRKTKRRTVRQNSLYWLYITAIAVESGNDKDDVHEYFANRYLPKTVKEVFGVDVEKRISTSDLSTADFAQYIERVRLDAEQMGYPMPSPDSPLFEQFMGHYDRRII